MSVNSDLQNDLKAKIASCKGFSFSLYCESSDTPPGIMEITSLVIGGDF